MNDRSGFEPAGLPEAVAAERRDFTGRAGRIAYYVADDDPDRLSPPILLIHSVNAAASVKEMAPLFDRCRPGRTVYAMDLPGFGFSARGDRLYSPRLMTDAIHSMREEIATHHGPQPVDAVALSLGCEFLARAAVERPEGWHSLGLISPTGFEGARGGQSGAGKGAVGQAAVAPGSPRRRGAPGSTLAMPWLHKTLAHPAWGAGLFRLLTKPASVGFFMRKTFGSANVDPSLIDYAVRTAREPGAEHAPFRFVSGYLFSGDILNVYESLTRPVWMTHGTRGDFVDYRGKAAVEGRANWRIEVIEGGAMPHYEYADAFFAAYRAFLTTLARAG